MQFESTGFGLAIYLQGYGALMLVTFRQLWRCHTEKSCDLLECSFGLVHPSLPAQSHRIPVE